MVYERAYAKINFTLKVYDQLENGFHTLETLMAPIDLYDELYFEENDEDKIIIKGMDIENNSIYNACKLLKAIYNFHGVTITVKKNIPLEAGLGGGSADSSATLRGLNKLFNLAIPDFLMQNFAKSLGSDNTFCLYEKAAICRHFGEELEFVKEKIDFDILVLKPDFGLSTKKVFEKLNIIRFLEPLHYELLWENFLKRDYETINKLLFNDLLKPAIEIEPRLKELMDEIKNLGFKAHLSGSGSALFVIDEKAKLEVLQSKLNLPFKRILRVKNTLSQLPNA